MHMPPKQRFTREEIIAAALQLVRREGNDGITARKLGTALACSPRPIFTAFENMDEVRRETVQAARALYDAYVEKGLAEPLAFRGVGMQYIRFAKEEPRLFALLFMTAGKTAFSLADVLPMIDGNSDKIMASIQEAYGLSQALSYKIYQAMWIFSHGIACLCATGVSRLTEAEARELLTEAFMGLLTKVKGTKGESDKGESGHD